MTADVAVLGLKPNVRALTAGDRFTCAIDVDRAVWCWGFNGDGQLGDGTTSSSLVPVAVVA